MGGQSPAAPQGGGPTRGASQGSVCREHVGHRGPVSVLSWGAVRGQPEAPPMFTGPVHHPGCGLGRCTGLCGRPAKEMPWAPSSFRAGRCRGARMWLGTWCPGTFTVLRRPSQQHLSSEVPQLKTREASCCNGLGSSRHRPSARWGSAGTGGDTGQAGSGSSGSWRESSGDTGAHSQCARHAPQGMERVQQRVREGQGRLRGPGVRQSLRAGLRSWCRDPWWVLLAPGGTGGCRGNSWAEVGVGPGPAPRGW